VKLSVSADMEGTAAAYYRRLMSREVRAAIDAAREAAVTDVLINNSHSAMRNVLWDELPASANAPV
jgi:D-aminopeptidase